ncbi:MAG: hypothetical protein CME38_18865 [Haliea sp.]|nr:hypothetical protein [Haliea sp.]
MSPFDQTFWLLEQWAHWSKVGDGGNQLDKLNYAAVAPGFQSLRRASSSPQISDAVAAEVDRTVATLCQEDPESGRAVCLYFFRRATYQDVARRMNIERRRAAALVKNGIAWISDFLDNPER